MAGNRAPMAKLAVRLASGRRVSLAAYADAWKRLRRMDPRQWFRETPGSSFGGTAADALREMRAGLDDRINRHIPAYGRGRKWDPNWQTETARAARALNTPRLAIHWLPPHLRERFASRLT